MKITIRKATADDASAAWDMRNAAINRQCAKYYLPDTLQVWTSGDVSKRFADDLAGAGYVAMIDGDLAGSGIIDLATGKIDAMFVHPEFMGCGVGKRIISYLESLARQAGLSRLHLESSLNAARFYRSCGFVGDELAEYHSPKGISLECVLMHKHL